MISTWRNFFLLKYCTLPLLSSQKRFWELDFFRGCAVLGMIVFHAFFIVKFSQNSILEMYQTGWLVLARSIQVTFLTLVGISLVISYFRAREKGNVTLFYERQMKRALILIVLGILLSFITFIFLPGYFIRFGILHVIGMSVLTLIPVVPQKHRALVFSVLILVLGYFRRSLGTSSYALYIFGFYRELVPTLDYFPIFPWMGFVAFGIFLGHFFYPHGNRKWNLPEMENFFGKCIVFMGKRALIIYLIHIPILLISFFVMGVIS
ncbi:DUF1624 domain-containing protein [Candidatus Peregrinibacteria bacterium]|nr:DUF1624 domain-containing protein [Candidatus Peregrinibacteria bacterium]